MADVSSPRTRSISNAPWWMKWTLGLSLVANLIVVGLIGGIAIKHSRGEHQGIAHQMIKFFVSGALITTVISSRTFRLPPFCQPEDFEA
jgi:hypothetical protein